MQRRVFLGVAVGTSSSQGVLATAEGQILRTAAREHGRAQVIPSKIIGASFGAAFLATTLEHDVRIEDWNPPAGVCEPDGSTKSGDDDLYAQYLYLYPATREINHVLARRQKSLTPKECA